MENLSMRREQIYIVSVYLPSTAADRGERAPVLGKFPEPLLVAKGKNARADY